MKRRPDLKDLTGCSNNAGDGVFGLGGPASRVKAGSQLMSAPLVKTKQIKKMILSYVGTNKNLQDAYLAGEVSLELSPQGTIAERLRAAAAGMPGFFTRTGAGESRRHWSQPELTPGTLVETGGIPQLWSKKAEGQKQEVLIPGTAKDVQEFDGKRFLFEPALHGDVGILRAWKVDKAGNCVFR